MQNIEKQFKNSVALFGLLVAFGCTDLDETLYDKKTPEDFFKTEKDFVSAIGVAYTSLYGLGGHGGFFSLQEISSDEVAIPLRGTDWGEGGQWINAHRHEMKSHDPSVGNAWNWLYSSIFQCNRLIYQLAQLKTNGAFPPATVDPYIAEMRALRALYYYWLLDTYGNVPLIKDYLTEGNPGTTPRADVFFFVEQEINDALPLLSKNTDGATYSRMGYYACKALQAKLYLNAGVYTGTPRWADCLAACDEIISPGHFALTTHYRDNFITENQGSSEFIFAVPFDETYAQGFSLHQMTLHYSAQATYNLQQQPWNGYCSLQEFYNLHDDADARKKNFITGPQYAADGTTPIIDPNSEPNDPDGPQVNHTPEIEFFLSGAFRQAGARIGKYEFKNGAGQNLNNDMPVFRYADILLTKAEALWREDNNSTQALDLVNQVRNRAYEPDQPFTALTAQNLLAERGREMFYEGTRRQDLIRFGVYGNPTEFMPGSEPCKELWPIPAIQMNFTPNIIQNPCY